MCHSINNKIFQLCCFCSFRFFESIFAVNDLSFRFFGVAPESACNRTNTPAFFAEKVSQLEKESITAFGLSASFIFFCSWSFVFCCCCLPFCVKCYNRTAFLVSPTKQASLKVAKLKILNKIIKEREREGERKNANIKASTQQFYYQIPSQALWNLSLSFRCFHGLLSFTRDSMRLVGLLYRYSLPCFFIRCFYSWLRSLDDIVAIWCMHVCMSWCHAAIICIHLLCYFLASRTEHIFWKKKEQTCTRTHSHSLTQQQCVCSVNQNFLFPLYLFIFLHTHRPVC